MTPPDHSGQLRLVHAAAEEDSDGLRRDAERLRVALDTLEALGPSTAVPQTAVLEMEAISAELVVQREAAPDGRAEQKRQLWGAVATARAELKRLEGAVTATTAVSGASLAALEALQAERDAAEARARRPMSGGRAYKAFVAARRKLEAALAEAGVASIEEARAAARPADAGELDEARRRAEQHVAEAERAWQAFEDRAGGWLPRDAEGEALRARAYRALGEVVDDDDLEWRLAGAIDLARQRHAATVLLESAIRAIGLAPGEDPASVARSILAVVARVEARPR